MIQEGTDWMNDLLKFLYKHYTGWDVPLNKFLEDEFKIPINDEQKAQGVLKVLKELEDAGLITKAIQTSMDGVDKSPMLKTDNFNARLTFQGLVYIQGVP